MNPIVITLSLLALCSCVSGSLVHLCGEGKSLDNEHVSLSDCDRPPCRLRKKTTVAIELKFTPPSDVEEVKNSVHAEVLGISLPFIGVDGASVCDKMFDAVTGAKASCPLKKAQSYVYKDEFKILEIYPKLKLTVHWALKDENDEDIMCFEVPAKITS